MPGKAERVILNIAGDEVGVGYEGVTIEAEQRDRLVAYELGLWALCKRCVDVRRELNLPIPRVFHDLIAARTVDEIA